MHLILLHVREEKRPVWTEEEEEELRKLYEEHRHSEGLPFVRTSSVFVVWESLNTVAHSPQHPGSFICSFIFGV